MLFVKQMKMSVNRSRMSNKGVWHSKYRYVYANAAKSRLEIDVPYSAFSSSLLLCFEYMHIIQRILLLLLPSTALVTAQYDFHISRSPLHVLLVSDNRNQTQCADSA